eukprot:m.80881 g.80881  ORF g.80881 m.80881 type:complete len:70 (+) comp8063_c0_seq1:533-742(+)
MGEMPYLICFGTAGNLIQFYAMDPDRNLIRLHPFPLDVCTVAGVLQLTLAVINLVHIIPSMLCLAASTR